MPDVTIKMNVNMVTAANFVLQQREIKGRSDMRVQKGILTALLAANSAEEEVVINGKKEKQKIVRVAPLTMEKSQWEALYSFAEDKVKNGFPAGINDGMCDLLDAIEEQAKVESEDAEVAQPKVTDIKTAKK
jgi:hypothetical protein